MAVSSFPIWVILSMVCFILLIIVAKANYYLPRMSRLRAICAKDKSTKQRSNMILRMRRRIKEEDYQWIVLLMYAIVTVCFIIENRSVLFNGGFLLLKVLAGLFIWLFSALFVVSFMVAFMKVLQENAVKDLKNYYSNHYGVTIVYIHEKTEKEYQDFELSN